MVFPTQVLPGFGSPRPFPAGMRSAGTPHVLRRSRVGAGLVLGAGLGFWGPTQKLADGYLQGTLPEISSLARILPLGPRLLLPKLLRKFVSKGNT